MDNKAHADQKLSSKYYAIQWHGYLEAMNPPINLLQGIKMAANIIRRH